MKYQGDTFHINMTRYSDPDRLNLARNAAIYLGKPDRDNIKRPLGIIAAGHVPEIFRGEHVEFEFVDVSKEVYDHIITYTTRDMRATGGNRALASHDYTLPSDKMKNPELVEEAIAGSMSNYQALLDAKETKQVARSAMPVAAKMNPFVYQFNFLTLGESLFTQRIWEKGAQSNTAKVVKGMYHLCKHMDAELWETFYQYCGEPALEWKEVRRKLDKKGYTVQWLINELYNGDVPYNPETTIIEFLTRKFGSQKSMW